MPNTLNEFLNWTADLDKKAESAQLGANLKTIPRRLWALPKTLKPAKKRSKQLRKLLGAHND